YGVEIPNVDTISEFNVEASSFSAEHGRNPLQVVLVTKSGQNKLFGTLWEFHRNQKLDARNTFALSKPKLIRNQFGFTMGGPIVRDKTHFFAGFEGITVRRESIYNSTVPRPEMFDGNFSALARQIRDPVGGQPFSGNIIPADRISGASKFFFPYLLRPNSPDGRFRAVASLTNDTKEQTYR